MSCPYYRDLARIVKNDGRSTAWKRRAVRHLEHELGAEKIKRRNREVGIETDSGKVLCQKKPFRTLEAADAALEQIALFRTQSNEDERVPTRSYQCQHCGKFHLTSWS